MSQLAEVKCGYGKILTIHPEAGRNWILDRLIVTIPELLITEWARIPSENRKLAGKGSAETVYFCCMYRHSQIT